MTESIKLVTFIDIIFIVMLMISGSLDGAWSEISYYLAFILPMMIGYYASRQFKHKREEIVGVAEPEDKLLAFNKKNIVTLAPLAFPAIALIFTVSLLTSILLSAFGISSPPVENTGIVRMLLVHALVPALFEEALFRYIPMKLLLPYSSRMCVLYSALCFALIHCSFSQMPYAFVAGVLFMMIDVAIGSVWPSVILHFINNAASVIWIMYCTALLESLIFVGVLFALAIIGAVVIYRKRNEYKTLLAGAFIKGEVGENSYAPFMLAVICCYIAFTNLFT